jgi:hypothetical protein
VPGWLSTSAEKSVAENFLPGSTYLSCKPPSKLASTLSMQKLTLALLMIPFFTACAQKETRSTEVTAKAEGIHISAKEFFKLTREDISNLNRAIAAPRSTTVALSDRRQAKCRKKVCQLTGKHMDGSIGSSELEQFSKTLRKAQASKKEEQLQVKWVTLRCVPDQCVADLQIDENKPVVIKGTANVTIENDFSGFLLGSVVGGMIKAAISL